MLLAACDVIYFCAYVRLSSPYAYQKRSAPLPAPVPPDVLYTTEAHPVESAADRSEKPACLLGKMRLISDRLAS